MSAFAVLTTLFLFSGFAVSDVTYPSCNVTSLDWTYNSLSQSPCEIASYLISTCWGGGYSLWPLEWEWVYIGPTEKNTSDARCWCNTVAYSVLCACGACQDHNWISWQDWATNCSTLPPPSTFPNTVPVPIVIPHWALVDVTVENIWNPVTAKAAGDSPEIGPGAIIGSSTSSTGPTGSTTPSSGGGGSNTKAIIGGVVGAAATLVIVTATLGALYLRRRRRKNRGVREAIAEDETIASPLTPDPPLTSTLRETYDPSDPTTSMFGPEMQATPWTPDVSSQVVSGPHQESGTALPVRRPSSESPPPYGDMPAVPTQSQTPTPDQSRSPRLRRK